MGLMNKLKNLFTEEVEEEIEEVEPIKKEVVKVEIPAPQVKKEEPVIIKAEESEMAKPVHEDTKEEEYKFPFFADEDFAALEKKEEKPVEKKSSYQRPLYKAESKEVYNPVKEEKKNFRPTPIISPVYGILDKNYQKEDIKSKNTKLRSYYDPKEATVDEIRNKAYGTLEDDIETTLFGKKEENDFTEEENEVEVPVKEVLEEKPRHGSDELTDLLEAELTKEEDEKPRKISDKELFSMIDSMYQKGDKE
ncbi:MAG: hypothetical protein IJ093_02390 [Bacilli bacterium]|nr:hypothetical protein [Bacilli bacterium]